jgi:Lysyl oxidase
MRRGLKLLAATLAAFLVTCAPALAFNNKGSSTLSNPGQTGVTWQGEHFSNAVSPPVPEACGATDCDEFNLTVALPADVWSTPGGVQIGIRWRDEDEGQDLDLYVYGPDGSQVAKSDGFFASQTESVLIKNAPNGNYRIVVVPRLATDLSYTGLAEVERLPSVSPLREMRPNLIPLPPRNISFKIGAYLFVPPGEPTAGVSSCYPEEMVEQGAARCMRFDQIISNQGPGPFELRYRMEGLATDQRLEQRIYRSDGTYYDRFADTYEFHPAHAHFHYKNFAQSRLWVSDAYGHKLGTAPIRTGKKNGFCMIDVDDYWFGRKGDAARTYYFPRCNAPTEVDETGTSMVNGISVGWADVYNWYLADQFIEVTGVPDGYYILETISDPNDTVLETKNTDNTVQTLIRLCGNAGEIVGQESVCG